MKLRELNVEELKNVEGGIRYAPPADPGMQPSTEPVTIMPGNNNNPEPQDETDSLPDRMKYMWNMVHQW